MTISMQPLVSVIVPVYNVQAYLDACLDSVRGQTYGNLEIILVEDCSTDDSLRVLKKHLADERVRLLQHEQNGGLSAARNTGIEAARGDYLLFVDSDDLVEPDLVEACVTCALDHDADVVLFDFMPFPDGGAVQSRRPVADVAPTRVPARDASYFTLPQFAWLKLIRTSLVQERDLRFPVGYYYEDGPFHWELGLCAERVFHLGAPYYHYRQRATSITGSRGRKLFDQLAIQRLIADILDRNGEVAGARERLVSSVYRSVWFIANWIDDELLGEALELIRDHLKATRRLRAGHSPDAKTRLLLLLIGLPRPLALASTRALRRTMNAISPARRAVVAKKGEVRQSSVLVSG